MFEEFFWTRLLLENHLTMQQILNQIQLDHVCQWAAQQRQDAATRLYDYLTQPTGDRERT